MWSAGEALQLSAGFAVLQSKLAHVFQPFADQRTVVFQPERWDEHFLIMMQPKTTTSADRTFKVRDGKIEAGGDGIHKINSLPPYPTEQTNKKN